MIWFVANTGGQVLFEPGEGVGFVFVVKNGLSMAEIPQQWVGAADNKKCGCCGSERNCFRRATQQEIEQYKK